MSTKSLHSNGPSKQTKIEKEDKKGPNSRTTSEDDPAIKRSRELILIESAPVPPNSITVTGYDFNKGINYQKLLQSYFTTGFQANHFGQAVKIINAMIDTKMEPPPQITPESFHREEIIEGRKTSNCTIFLGYTSNMASAGTRDIIRYLAEHNMVDVVATTAGGIEEDFIKCFSNFYLGDFKLDGATLHTKSHNRTGNLIVPNNSYKNFNMWLSRIIDDMLKEQEQGFSWTPSKFIWRLGKEINNRESIYYWCYINKIPVFCPAITDGAIGDLLFHHYVANKRRSLKLDIVEDIHMINSISCYSVNAGHLILGGGLAKHHCLNATCHSGGAKFAVYINTSQEFDGCDAGASPEEAVSWGKIQSEACRVKISADASLIIPLLVAETFAKREKEFQQTISQVNKVK